MKLKNAKDYLPFVQAVADGKQLQARVLGVWTDCSLENSFGYYADSPTQPVSYFIRIKPEPTLRAWKAIEVPLGALIRPKSENRGWTCVITSKNWSLRPSYFTIGETKVTDFESTLMLDEHSIDGGKTWNPCGVLES